MKDAKELFDKLCMSPDWGELPPRPFVRQHKDLETLTEELEGIKNRIDELKAKEWNILKRMQFNQEGFH